MGATLASPNVRELFSDVTDSKDLSLRNDEFNAELKKSFEKGSGGAGAKAELELERMTLDKSMAPDVLANLQNALEQQRELNKNVTLTSPLSTSFAVFDLETPAKLLFPKPTPLVNKIVRRKGTGLAHRAKILTGITGSGTGGNANIHPGLVETSTAAYGALTLNRGVQITQSAEDLIVGYSSFALGNSVTFDAEDTGVDFGSLRAQAVTNTMYAMKLMEERMFLMGRGTTANGFEGALAAPATVTLTSPVASGSETALAATTYYVYVTADAGAFGESVPSTVQSTAVAGGDVLSIAITAVAGALGYNIYVGTTTGLANCTYQGRTTGLTFVVQGAASKQYYNTAPYTTTGAAATRATADTSAYTAGYDGILPILLAGSNINDLLGAVLNTANPGVEFQQVFGDIWDSVKGDPDEMWFSGSDRKQLSNAVKTAGSTNNYRMEISQTEIGHFVGGLVMTGLINDFTGKMVDMTVHPWLPQGVVPVMSYRLPIPDTNVDEIWASVNVQDYRGTQWPVIQRSYDNEVSLRGTFMCYAPAWNGIVSGIKQA